jgi:tetratricopeptide (TPR) repeat protein
MVQQAIALFMQKKHEQAIELFQKYLTQHFDEPVHIDGLGNNELAVGYYEWFIPEWYKEGIEQGIYLGTAYDYLSLCYLSAKAKDDLIEAGIKWYRSMLESRPDHYPLRMGYSNILSNKSIYEEAIEQYNRVAELRPGWVRPL